MNSVVNVFYFLIIIISIATCCHGSKCLCECMCRWMDYRHMVARERAIEEERRTVIHPIPIPLPFPNRQATKIIPADKYVVFLNPGNCPMSIGLPKEYSNV